MNNSDFLSDTVALDLGKSGVKVAETLEIEVGDEWWRLINAADVSTVRAYQGRRVNEGAISGGEMDLSGFGTNALQTPGSWDTGTFPFQNVHVCINGENQLFFAASYSFYTGLTSLRVWSAASELASVVISSTTTTKITDLTSRYRAVYFDGVNNRIVAAFYGSGVVYSLASGTTSGFSGVSVKSADFLAAKTFPEAPADIYSFYLSSAGGAKVKRTTPTAGQNAATQMNLVTSNTGATVLTAITNFSLSHGLHPFYLRSAESVAVAWVDATSGQIGYVLESESWATPRYFPAISGMLGDSIAGMGSLYLPLDGEFLVVGRNGYSTGNVAREPGYSFPENWSLLGAYPNGEGKMRLFGLVGTTLYGYDLTLSTMSLTYLGVASTSWPWESYLECTVVGSSGDFDLLAFTQAVKGTRATQGLVKYNRVTNTIVWTWRSYTSALFPNSSGGNGGAFFRVQEALLFLCQYNATYYASKIDSYLLNVDSIVACASAAELTGLMSPSELKTATFLYYGTDADADMVAGVNGSVVNLTYDSQNFYLLLSNDATLQPNGVIHRIRLDRATRTDASGSSYSGGGGDAWLSWTGNGSRTLLFSLQTKNGPYPDTQLSDDAQRDNLSRISVGTTAGGWLLGFWSPLSNVPAKEVYVGANGTKTGYANTIMSPVVGLRGEMTSYVTYGTHVRLFGASWDLNTKLGDNAIYFVSSFSPNKSFQDEANDAAVYFGAVSGGELPYIKHSAIEGLLTGIHAIRISDGTAYTVNLGHACAGGLAAFSPCGSWLVYRSGSGVFRMMPTGASLTDGMGEGGSGGGSAVGLYVYDYLDQQFIPYPFAREGIRAELSNISKTTKITLPETQDNLIRGMLAAGTDFRGSRCILRRVFPDHIDEAGADIVLLDGYIQDWSYVPEKAGIAFTVSKTLIDVGGQFPKRLMNMGCSHVFKGDRCRYLGEEGRCMKTKAFCTSLENLNQFGGFPWVAARQRRVMWK